MKRRTSLASISLALCGIAAHARAQCGAWNGPFELGGTDGVVKALARYDDGSGEKLYVGGFFSNVFGVSAINVAASDANVWSAVGGGIAGDVRCMAVFDDGSGAALYVGGYLNHIGGTTRSLVARWDGAAWSLVAVTTASSPEYVLTLETYVENGVERLFAGGTFSSIGGVPCAGLARFDGASWSPVGGGLQLGSGAGVAYALKSFDDGSGAALYVGGRFDSAGTLTTSPHLARWDGAAWSSVGGGTQGVPPNVYALESYDDGNGEHLYAGGWFSSAGGVPAQSIARWNGSAWSALGLGMFNGAGGSTPIVSVLQSFDDGSGAKLYCSGYFAGAVNTGGASVASPHFVRWDGAAWSSAAGGVPDTSAQQFVNALETFAGKLYLGGQFAPDGGMPGRNLATFYDGRFASAGGTHGLDATVFALLAVESSALGSGLYAAGDFIASGSGSIAHVGRWDGAQWHPLASGVDGSARALALFDDGTGTGLYVGGEFANAGGAPASRIARWNGTSWSALGSGVGGVVRALAAFDDGSGPALYAAGAFAAAGGVGATSIARWNGASWSSVGDALAYNGSSAAASLAALQVFDDGTGPALYAGGWFNSIGATNTRYLARWDGTQWSKVGLPQVSNSVSDLTVYDDGAGVALYASGTFAFAGGMLVKGIARWNGSTWSDLGTGVDFLDGPYALAVHQHAAGSVLVAGGHFNEISGTSASNIAQWDGSTWSPLGSGTPERVFALATFDDGSKPWPQLFAGGYFASAGGLESQHIARWSDPCACTATSYCTAGTTSSGCVPSISGAGTPSASQTSGFTIRVDQVEGDKQGHIAYSLTGPLANPWSPQSSSFLCIQAPTQRTPSQNSGGAAGTCDGVMTLDWNAYVAAHPLALGAPFSAGTGVWAQLYFRDPPAPKTTNLSDGLRFFVCP